MAVAATLPQPNFPHKSPIGRSGVLVLYGFGIKVRMQCGHLELEDGVASERRKIRLPRVGHGLKRLICISEDGFTTLSALKWLAEVGVSFVMLNRNGQVLLVTMPTAPSDARLRRAQSLAHQSGLALQIAKGLINRKLIGQERLVRRQFGNEDATDVIAKCRNALSSAKTNDEVRRFEAQAALSYWDSWHKLPVTYSAADLRRVPDHWQSFGSRHSCLTNSPRLATNPLNAVLNYLYAVAESEATLALASLGIDPGIGFLHADSRKRDSCACDLLEAIRPQVDEFVLEWLRREHFRREWFFEERNGNCRLMGSFAARLSETAQIWSRAVAPYAGWISHVLSSEIPKAGRRNGPATRLTQRKRREARDYTCPPNQLSVTNQRRGQSRL
jgi:CRISPR-associated endonuclease Cas1